MQERKQREEALRAVERRLAQQVDQQQKQYKEELKASKAATKLQKQALLRELEQGMKAEAKQRFNEQRGMIDARDIWVHKPVLEGKATAFV